MTGHRQFATTAECEAINSRYHRLGAGLESAKHILSRARTCFAQHRGLARQFGDVGAGDEGASSAGEDHAADRIVNADFVDGVSELGDGRIVEGVELVGTVDRQRGDAVRDLQRQEFEGHGDVFVGRFAAAGGRSLAPAKAKSTQKVSLLGCCFFGAIGVNGAEVDRS